MEFSGQNKAATDGVLTKGEQAQQNFIAHTLKMKSVKFIIGIILGFMVLLALIVRDGGGLPLSTLVFESLLMALCGALPVIMIAVDRKEKNKLKIVQDFFIYFIAFFIGHFILQYGGFYTHTFMKKPDED